jgi:dihydrodipicolinate synthase/N-acetylneuraminate lyase
MKKPTGVIVPLITPHNPSDLFPLIDHVVEGGINRIIVLGTTGEGAKLTQTHKLELIIKIAKHVGNNAHIIVGINSTKKDETIDLMKAADDIGAYGCMIIPALLGDNPVKVIDDLLSSSEQDILLYNNPSLCGNVSLEIEDVAQLLTEKRVLGIKDSSGDLEYLDQLIHIRGKHAAVLYGREYRLKEAITKNIDGIVTGGGNVDPELVCRLWKEKANGPWKEWDVLKTRIQELNPNNIQGLKMLLKERGLITDDRLW